MPLTQAQQSYGTGSQYDQRTGGMPAGGWDYTQEYPQVPSRPGTLNTGADYAKLWGEGYGPQYGQAVDMFQHPAAMSYASLFGNITPQTRVGGMTTGAAGEAGGFAPDPTNGGGANNQPKPAASTPAQAGENNSLMPGWSNGNQDVGVAAPPGGATKPLLAPTVQQLPGRTATDPLNVAMQQAAPPPPAPVEYPPVTTAGPAGGQAPAPVATQGQPMAAGETQVQAQEAAAPAAAPQGEAQVAGQEPAAAPAAPETNPDGTPKAAAAAEIPHGVTIHGKDHGTTLPTPVNVPAGKGGNFAGVISQAGGDNYLINVADKLYKLIYGSANATGESWSAYRTGGGKGVTNPGNLIRKIDGLTAFLKSRGINFDPKAQYELDHPAPGTVTPPGGDVPGDGTTPPVGDGGVGGQADQPGSNTQLNDLDVNSALSTLSSIMGGGKNDPAWRRFLGEMAFQLAQYNAARQDQQDAVDIQAGANADFKNDPLRLQEQGIMSGILDNPDPTPWDLVRNQAITGSNQTADDARATWERGASRRMGSAGAAATPGVYADAQRDQGNQLQNMLAQFEIQKAGQGRNYALQSMSAADQFRQNTSGADAQLATILANMRRGAPQVAANPIAGAGEGYANSWAQSGLEDQGSNAGDFMSWMKGAFGGASDGTDAGNAGATQHSDIVGLFGGFVGGGGMSGGAAAAK